MKCGLHLPQGLKGDRSPPGVDVNEDGRSFAGLHSEAVIVSSDEIKLLPVNVTH